MAFVRSYGNRKDYILTSKVGIDFRGFIFSVGMGINFFDAIMLNMELKGHSYSLYYSYDFSYNSHLFRGSQEIGLRLYIFDKPITKVYPLVICPAFL